MVVNLLPLQLTVILPMILKIMILRNFIQKQAPRGVLLKRCSWKFRKIHRKTPVPESFLLKLQVLGLQLY